MYLKQCNGEHAQINHGQRLAVKRIQLVDTVHDTVTILLRYCYDTVTIRFLRFILWLDPF